MAGTCKVLDVVPSACKGPVHICCRHHQLCRPREDWKGSIHLQIMLFSVGQH